MTSRGIDAALADRWQLGYVGDPMPGHERFVGSLAIPYVTQSGTVSIRFRCIKPHDCGDIEWHHKYDAELGSGIYLYGVTALNPNSTFMCVTEGELDCVVANASGLPAVGVSGVTNWRSHWQYLFEGYADVIVLRDGDNAGEKLARAVTDAVHHARVVSMPDGHDVNSFLLAYGAEALRERVGADR